LNSSWDIFCRVVDNYGDIGVCWRLARQLAAEHEVGVRLWIDNLESFARLCPALNVTLDTQRASGVTVCRWRDPFPDAVPGDIVVEAFGCEIPAGFKTTMAARSRAPAWINLEYLSAEAWVTESHALPSPQATLTKYFFFPGFVAGTGGLLRERGLMAQREKFQQDRNAQAEFWHSLGLTPPESDELRVSLFCYDNPALSDLLRQWAESSMRVTCLVPEGVVTAMLEKLFSLETVEVNQTYTVRNLTVRVIPFLDQERYDRLLWACDINFVRGEDSFVRAQWAARPFVWHVYPQSENAHRVKLDAFVDLFCADWDAQTKLVMRSFWHGWNGDGFVTDAWREWVTARESSAVFVSNWSDKLCRQPDLAANLVRFTNDLLK
jgi:uncharacterized repeat protein (TIGR03837 family)